MAIASQFLDMTSSSNFLDVLFLLPSLVTGPSFMYISSLVVELWQSGNWNTPVWVLPNIWRLGQVRNCNLARMSLIKCYWMLQNARVIPFTVFELLRENQRGGGREVKLSPLPRLGLKRALMLRKKKKNQFKSGN